MHFSTPLALVVATTMALLLHLCFASPIQTYTIVTVDGARLTAAQMPASLDIHYSLDGNPNWVDATMAPGPNPRTFVVLIPAVESAQFALKAEGDWWIHCNAAATPSVANCTWLNGNFNFMIPPGNFAVELYAGVGGGIDGNLTVVSVGPLSCPTGPDSMGGDDGNVIFTPTGADLALQGSMTATCSRNGKCSPFLQCECRGGWAGVACETCACPLHSFCEAGSGRCVSNASSSHESPSEIRRHGITVVLLNLTAYTNPLWKSTTTVYGNIQSLSTNGSAWHHFPTYCAADENGPVQIQSDGFAVSDALPSWQNYTDCGVWRVAVLPSNFALFVVFSFEAQLYTHCASIAPQGAASGARCVNDHHDERKNFLAFAGVVQIDVALSVDSAPMTVIDEYPTGCQWGSHNATLEQCSGTGLCNAATSFNCDCDHFDGVGCGNCTCRGPHELCAPLSGACVCSSDALRCGDGLCHKVDNDVENCGQCNRSCYEGQYEIIESASCSAGQCHVVFLPKMQWKICFGEEDGGDVACFKGYAFVVMAVISAVLCAMCLWSWRSFRKGGQATHHLHRQTLFLLLAIIGGLRLVYGAIAIAVIGSIRSPQEARRGEDFFRDSMITLNAFADLVTGMVDVLLTTFWLFVLQRITTYPRRALHLAYASMLFTLTVATIIDYQAERLVFNYTFFTIAIILFFTAAAHMTVIGEVLMKMREWNRLQQELSGESAALLRASGSRRTANAIEAQSDVLRRVRNHFFRVSFIAVTCAVCWTFRCVMLLGRATKKDVFVSGSLSFANPTFTLVYYSLLSMLPCIVIAAAFGSLRYEVLSSSTTSSVQPVEQASCNMNSVSRVSFTPAKPAADAGPEQSQHQ